MEKASNLLIRYGMECVNWPDSFPYKPEVSFCCNLEGELLHIGYKVKEQSVRAVEAISGNPVHRDSCVEFFIKPRMDDPHYYNFEWNAIGTLDLSYRTGRADAEKAPQNVLDIVKADSSLGILPFEERLGEIQWTLDVRIPISALWRSNLKTWKGLDAKCNFYKCGDSLTVPHFISWAPVRTENPDFHRPEFFKLFIF